MKHTNLISLLLITIAVLSTLTSCTNDDPVSPTPTVIEDNVKSGTWRITSFIDSGKDETNHFTGYSFTFGSNGTLTATNGSTVHTGTWSITNGNSNDDSPDDEDFNIFFALANNFEDLNEDWHFISQSESKIELIHVSGGNGGTDSLTFEKI